MRFGLFLILFGTVRFWARKSISVHKSSTMRKFINVFEYHVQQVARLVSFCIAICALDLGTNENNIEGPSRMLTRKLLSCNAQVNSNEGIS